jgi:HEAT repeat protein
LSLILESLQAAYDRLIRNGSFSTLTEILVGLKRLLAEHQFESDRFEKRLIEFHQRSGDMVRIKMITKRLNENPDTELRPVVDYFRHLGWESLNNMIWMLGELEHYPARRVLCDLLVEKGRDQIQLIGGAIYDSRWYVARNVAMIIGETEMTEGIAYLRRAAKHTDERVRLEAARALARIDGDEALKELTKLLDDPSERVGVAALNGIARMKNAPAFEYLREIVTAEDFADRELLSMRQVMEALIRCDGKESLNVVLQLLQKSSFFKRAKVRKLQEAILFALETSDSQAADNILNAVTNSTNSSLAAIARQILSRKRPNRGNARATVSSDGGGK